MTINADALQPKRLQGTAVKPTYLIVYYSSSPLMEAAVQEKSEVETVEPAPAALYLVSPKSWSAGTDASQAGVTAVYTVNGTSMASMFTNSKLLLIKRVKASVRGAQAAAASYLARTLTTEPPLEE